MKLRLKKDYKATLLRLQSYRLEGIVALLVLLAILLTLRPGIFSSDNALYLAVVGPMGGEEFADGNDMIRGVQLALDHVNREGGIQNRPLKLLTFHDGNSPEIARQQAEKIASSQNILMVLGHFSAEASLEAAEIYQQAGIPAISSATREESLTEGHDWYFRTTPHPRSQAIFLAYYLKQVLKHQRVNIISSLHRHDSQLTSTFQQTFRQLGGEVPHTWYFNHDAQDVEQEIDFIVKTISQELQQDKPGIFLISAGERALPHLLATLKRQGLRDPAVIEYETMRKADFSRIPEERKHPGSTLEGVFVTAPCIFFNVNSPRVQQFQEEFKEAYDSEPGVTGALYYDAALTAVQAIREADIQATPDHLNEDRAKIRDALASFQSLEHAIDGITGQLYFDLNGNAEKPLNVGIFENGNVIPALTQLQVADPTRIASLWKEKQADRILNVNGQDMYKTSIVYTGVNLREVSDLDPESLVCTLDFDLWFRYRGAFDAENIEFLNAAESIRMREVLPAENDVTSDIPMNTGVLLAEQQSEGITYRLYRVHGRFKADFLSDSPVFFREHVLGLSFRHRCLTQYNLLYLPDTLFMAQMSDRSFWEYFKQGQVFRAVAGWTIQSGDFFQDTFEQISLANPKNLSVRKWTEQFSRFNAGIWIKRDDFTLRGLVSILQRLIPSRFVPIVFLGSGMMVMAFFVVKKVKRLAYFSKSIWCVEACCMVLLMLSAERAFANVMLWTHIEMYYVKMIALIFDVLWWIVGAFLLTLAVERFVWTPLRKRTERPVPRILRHTVTIMIYLLAFFGIMAFVFGRDVNSLVATSGVFAAILAFVSKVDISNIFAGIGISFSQPFRIDDWVKIGDCEEGQVVDMTSRTTKVQTRDYSMLSIPNTTVASSVIENFNYPDARFRLQFTLETVPIYHPERVQKILLDAVYATDGALRQPEPQILFKGQGDSSAIYTVIFYIEDYAQKFVLKQSVWKHVWIHLERAGIELATPRREIVMIHETRADISSPLYMLNHVDLFDPLSDEAKTALSNNMSKQTFSAGESIVQQGEIGKSLFMIIEGSVGLWVQSEDGKPIEAARMGTGDVFGEMQLLTGDTRRFGVIALTDTCVYQIMKEHIAPFIQKHPELAERFSKKLLERQMVIDAQKELHGAQQISKDALSSQLIQRIQQFFSVKDVPVATSSSSQNSQGST